MADSYHLSPKREAKILADYAELQSLRKTAMFNNVSATTVKRVLKRNPDAGVQMAKAQRELGESVLKYMDSKRDKVCEFFDKALEVMNDREKIEKASIVQIATAIGILVDKWSLAAGVNNGINVTISGDAGEAGQ